MQCAERGGERGEQETQRKGGRGKETDRERQRMRKNIWYTNTSNSFGTYNITYNFL